MRDIYRTIVYKSLRKQSVKTALLWRFLAIRELLTFEPDYAVPPGETLKETIEFLGMTQKELSTRTGLSVQSLNRI